MWRENILGDNSPEMLLNILIYLLGVHLALHGVQEHKDLKVGAYSQLHVDFDPETDSKYLYYTLDTFEKQSGWNL